jgi:hypothetical protein
MIPNIFDIVIINYNSTNETTRVHSLTQYNWWDKYWTW